jgi:hypothetical protein
MLFFHAIFSREQSANSLRLESSQTSFHNKERVMIVLGSISLQLQLSLLSRSSSLFLLLPILSSLSFSALVLLPPKPFTKMDFLIKIASRLRSISRNDARTIKTLKSKSSYPASYIEAITPTATDRLVAFCIGSAKERLQQRKSVK